MKCLVFAFSVFVLAMTALAAEPSKKMGAEWTYDKEAHHYFKTMQIKVVRSAGGNCANYYLDLEHDKVRVADTDDNIATYVFLNDKFNLELRKDPKGMPSSVSVRIDKWTYYDLNCDGEWDARITESPEKLDRSIWLNDQWVRVKYVRGSFGEGSEGEVDFIDWKIVYKWDGKVWAVKPPRR